MAVISEQINENMVRHYSDQNMMIRQVETGYLFIDAGDFIPCAYTYEETDIPIVEPIEETEIDDSEALRIITGGAV